MSFAPHDDLDASVRQMRMAVLTAAFRKLRYKVGADEIAALIASNVSDDKAFDQVERRQPLLKQIPILFRRFRRWRTRNRR
jgi:hypothetical protein